MYLLMRLNNYTASDQEQRSVKEIRAEPNYSESCNPENGSMAGLSGKSNCRVDSHIDVSEDDGLIIIADKIPDNWQGAPDIHSYHSLDRKFVFAGEQVQLLVCLSANKHNSGIITSSENVIGQKPPRQNRKVQGTISVSQAECANTGEHNNQNGEAREKMDSQQDASTGKSFVRSDDQRRLQTGQFLQRFKNSHFFARISESDEPLWSERSAQEACFKLMETSKERLSGDSSETAQILKNNNPTSVVIDRGQLHSPTSGGIARGAAKCFSLSNGDIVVILQLKVGIEFMRDPILEILQFEKYHERNPFPENQQVRGSSNQDPYGELLNWLLPLNNARRPSPAPISPELSSRSSMQGTYTKRGVSVSSGSELFSFGHVRSYSMSSLQPSKGPPEAKTTLNAKPSLVQEDRYQFSFRSFVEIGNNGNENLLSFRGVSLVPDRFSVQCGLEGVFTPVRRWKRKIELIQPLEIHSFSVDCNTDDLLCVHIKNVSPAFAPDVVVFLDSITMVFEDVSSSGPPLSLPVTCIEAGNDYSLPNLALRKGEEHSFILKPVTMLWRHSKGQIDSNVGQTRRSTRTARSRRHSSSNVEWRHSDPPAVQYAVLVSCRCNYTESKLFFKHPVSWQPRIARDLMLSVTSEISRQTLASYGTQLPVQAITLHASNMTSDDLTLTVLAPTPLTTSPSLVSMHNLPFSPLSPFEGVVQGLSSVPLNQGQTTEDGPQSYPINNRPVSFSDMIPNIDLSCTHLCLRSRVPLGCVPSKSTVAINLEVLPLTVGIISLDSLQIAVKEKGRTYTPKHTLKIAAASSTVSIIM